MSDIIWAKLFDDADGRGAFSLDGFRIPLPVKGTFFLPFGLVFMFERIS